MLNFKRTLSYIGDFGLDLGAIHVVDLMSYKQFLQAQYDAAFIISDSGTAQEEPALLNTPVIVPRDFTERPESVENGCSYMLDVNSINDTWQESEKFLSNFKPNIEWLGEGKTSELITNFLSSL